MYSDFTCRSAALDKYKRDHVVPLRNNLGGFISLNNEISRPRHAHIIGDA